MAPGKPNVGLYLESKDIAKGMVLKEATAIGATAEGKALAQDALIAQATQNVASKIGQAAGVGAMAFGQEGGEIFGDLTSQAQKDGRELSGAELAKAFGATIAAGGLEFVGDKFGLDLVMGKSKLGNKLMGMADGATGIGGKLARGALAGAAAIPAEAGTEYFQTGLEEFGKGTEASPLPWQQSPEHQTGAFDAAMLGALGGGAIGLGGGLMSKAREAQAQRVLQTTTDVGQMAQAAAEIALVPLAPLHQPHNLAGVRALRKAFPALPQIGCFDTAFHADMPELETRFALPQALYDEGVRRYGFHGLSYDYVMQVLRGCSTRAGGRVLMAHLGSGASLCGARAGRSVATSMGFSALDGLMMGSRCGQLDPGVVLHLWRQGWTEAQVEQLLYKESGLLGVSGLSADMRLLRRAADDGNPQARTAIDLFTYRLTREAGALAAVLGGVDVLVCTGGIGEHDAVTRAALAQALHYLGVDLDGAANTAARGDEIGRAHV